MWQGMAMEKRLVWFCCLLTPVLVWSAMGAHDRFTWLLEVAPVLLGVPLALATGRRFPLSSLLLGFLWWHSVILIVGGHYTYALVPLGEWAKTWFGWTRNHYDKLGHFAQGFVPALLMRELLLRTSPLKTELLAAGARRERVSGVQCFLRIDRMVHRADERGGGGRFSGHAGRPVGYADGHAAGAHWGHGGTGEPATLA